ncbi:MAG: uracil phosphoribosyltransferase, partial [Duncaniella sp.]|nr:uracil phosphoribosyltransferase [Duncaniella sp.]
MEVINFADSPSLVSQYMSELRDINVQGDMLRFRRNLQRIGEIMAYEISKRIDYRREPVQTPLGTAQCDVIDTDIVLATIFRAGIPFHQGFLDFFDHAQNAFVSAYRKNREKENFDVFIEYIASPQLEGKTVGIADP